MKRTHPPDFPELQRVFSGYLHEDFLEEYESAAAALRAFHDDADPSDRQRFRREARRFLASIEKLELKDVRALMARLGCRWFPPSRRAVATLLTEAANLPVKSG